LDFSKNAYICSQNIHSIKKNHYEKLRQSTACGYGSRQKNLPNEINYAVLYPDHPAYRYGLDYVVEWEMSPTYTMGELFGIEAEQLPPAEKLTDEQIAQLLKGIYDLWQAFNYFPDSDDTPPRVFYTVVKNYWATQSVQYEKYTFIELDFCSYNKGLCVWGEHFKCKDLEFDTMEDYKFEGDSELGKGIAQNPNGSMSWINPKFLDNDGNFDGSQLPF
jgi:hypothetical protein